MACPFHHYYAFIHSLGPPETTSKESTVSTATTLSAAPATAADMVSRRKILSRSRDDLNLDLQIETEEDVWYTKEKLFRVSELMMNLHAKPRVERPNDNADPVEVVETAMMTNRARRKREVKCINEFNSNEWIFTLLLAAAVAAAVAGKTKAPTTRAVPT